MPHSPRRYCCFETSPRERMEKGKRESRGVLATSGKFRGELRSRVLVSKQIVLARLIIAFKKSVIYIPPSDRELYLMRRPILIC